MGRITRFEEIEAWQAARELTRLVYALSQRGAFARDRGLQDQMQRAAVSIMSNIAKGFESRTQGLFIELLGRAKGSAGEVPALAYVALDVGYIDRRQFDQLVALAETCSRRISRFMAYLKTQPNASRVQEDTVSYDDPLEPASPQRSNPQLSNLQPSNPQPETNLQPARPEPSNLQPEGSCHE